MSEPRTLREALDITAAAIDDRARFIEVNEHYRAGWVDGLRAVRDDPAVLALAAQPESAGPQLDPANPRHIERLAMALRTWRRVYVDPANPEEWFERSAAVIAAEYARHGIGGTE